MDKAHDLWDDSDSDAEMVDPDPHNHSKHETGEDPDCHNHICRTYNLMLKLWKEGPEPGEDPFWADVRYKFYEDFFKMHRILDDNLKANPN